MTGDFPEILVIMTDPDFLSYIGHTLADLETAKIEVVELRRIHEDHESRQADLRDVGETIQRALTRFSGVHSTRVRVKSSRSLVRKVVRKRIDDPERNLCFDTYKDEIRDLIGLRALHLFKEDWREIHKSVMDKWNLHPEETPLAYLREGDSEALEKQLVESGFEVKKKGGGYRSLHFVVQSQLDKTPCYAEIQVRTLFEEAWSEVDHQVRYPDHEDDELLSDYLLILNRLAGGADEMASLLLRVKSTIEVLQIANAELLQEQSAKDAEIERLRSENNASIEELDIPEEKKADLKQRFEHVTDTSFSERPTTSVSSLSRAIAAMNDQHSGLARALAAMNSQPLGVARALAAMNDHHSGITRAIAAMNNQHSDVARAVAAINNPRYR